MCSPTLLSICCCRRSYARQCRLREEERQEPRNGKSATASFGATAIRWHGGGFDFIICLLFACHCPLVMEYIHALLFGYFYHLNPYPIPPSAQLHNHHTLLYLPTVSVRFYTSFTSPLYIYPRPYPPTFSPFILSGTCMRFPSPSVPSKTLASRPSFLLLFPMLSSYPCFCHR